MDGAVGSNSAANSARGSEKGDGATPNDIMSFMNDRNAALGLEEADGDEGDDLGRRRTNAFHEYIPIEDPTIKPADLEGVI